jgi:DNA-3-methyladenine glycosylase II
VKAQLRASLDRLLGLHVDLANFYRAAASDDRLAPLAERFRGMRPPMFNSVFEAVVNGIACQQVSLNVGLLILNRLAELAGAKGNDDEHPGHAFPRPEDLAGLNRQTLRSVGFSNHKAQALIDLARAVSDGTLDLEALTQEPDAIVRDRLCALRGVGRWTAEYVLLRGFGRLNVFPGDDAGARNNLGQWLRRKASLDYEGVRRATERWQPYAGLVYFHLLLDRLTDSGAIGSAAYDCGSEPADCASATRGAPS